MKSVFTIIAIVTAFGAQAMGLDTSAEWNASHDYTEDIIVGNSVSEVLLKITSGAVITVTGRTSVGWNGVHNNMLWVDGEGTKFLSNGSTQAHLGNMAGAYSNIVKVTNGGYFYDKSTPFNIGQDGYRNGVIVDGEGSKAEFTNSINLGRANGDAAGTPTKGENFITVSNGGLFCCSNVVYIGGRKWAPSNTIDVTSGGVFVTTGMRIGAGNMGGSGSSYNRVFVAGEGSVLSNLSNTISLAYANTPDEQGHDNSLIISTNATFVTTGTLTIGDYGYNNLFRLDHVCDFAHAVIYIGNGADATNNRFEVIGPWPTNFDLKLVSFRNGPNCSFMWDGVNEVTLTEANPFSRFYEFQVYAPNSTVELRNLTFNATQVGTMKFTQPGQRFVFKDCTLTTVGANSPSTYLGVENDGGLGTFVLDGTKWTHGVLGQNNGYTNIGLNSDHNRIELINGAELHIKDSTTAIGNANNGTGGTNTLVVAGGSVLEFYRLRVNTCRNTLIISNATVSATIEFSFPNSSGNNNEAIDNRIEFYGSTPRLVCPCAINFTYRKEEGKGDLRDTVLHFAVPRGGYAQAPIESTNANVNLNHGNYITADVEEFMRGGGGRTILAKAAAGKKVYLLDMNELGSRLPTGCRLALNTDQTELYLIAPDTRATLITVR